MSIVDFEAAAEVWSALGAAMLIAFVVFESSSLLTGAAGFAEMSLEADRWGIFRMSLYFAWLLSSCQYKRATSGRSEKRSRDTACLGSTYGGGAAFVPSFRSVMMSISYSP